MAKKARRPIIEQVYDLREWSECQLWLRAEPVVGGVNIVDYNNGNDFTVTREDVEAAIDWLFRVRTLFEKDA